MSSQLSQKQYIAVLAFTSVAVLGLGVWLKPKELPKPTVTGEDTLRLRTLTQRRNLENAAAYFAEVAEGIQPSVVWLNELGMSGLVWNREHAIITAAPDQAVPKQVKAIMATGEMTLAPQIASSDFRASLFKAPAGAPLQPVYRGASGLATGSSLLLVSRQSGGGYLFTPGEFGGIVTTKCGAREHRVVQSNIPLSSAGLGGGLFDVDGNLLAVVLRCDDHFAAMTPGDVDREIALANTFDGQLLRAYGLRMAPLNDVSKKYFQTEEGMLVKDVDDGKPADMAGLVPGDVVISLDTAAVRGVEDLRPLLAPPGPKPIQLAVRRNGRIVLIQLQLNGPAAANSGGVGLTDLSRGYVIDNVVRGSRAERSGLQSGDQLLLLDGKAPANVAAVRSAFSDENHAPLFVVLRRGKRKIGTFLN